MNQLKKIAENEIFHSFILFLITLNALFLGCETYPYFQNNYGDLIWSVLIVSQVVFTVEIVIRVLAYYPNLKSFFKDFWNSFDFIIIFLSYLPIVGSFATVARVLRVLRILRVFSVSDKLRSYLSDLRHSSGVLVYTVIIYFVLSYIFALAGFYFFAELNTSHWDSLHRAFLSIFYLSLLQNIPSITEPILSVYPCAILFFIIFYVIFLKLFLVTLAAFVKIKGNK